MIDDEGGAMRPTSIWPTKNGCPLLHEKVQKKAYSLKITKKKNSNNRGICGRYY